MAADDTKETQAQFDLQVQINQVLQSRIGILKAQEKALSGQVQMAMDLCKALKCEQLDEIEARLKTARDEMQRAAEDAAALRTSLDEAAAAGADGADNTTGAMKRLRSGIDEVDGAAVGAALGIVRGFGSAFQTVTNLASGLGGILGTFGRLGKAIIGLPFQLLSGLFDIAQSGGGGGASPIRQELEKIRGEFGSLETTAGKVAAGALTQFRGEMSNLAGTGLRLSKVFGPGREGLAKALAENAELMKALGPAVDNFSDTLNKNAVALSMYRKGLGMTVEQQAKFMKFAQAAGKDPMKEMTKFASQAINMGESMGVSSKLISKDMAEMQSDFANFGGLGPKVMSQISVYTRKLGIEIKSLTGLISTFDDFEGAAQGAAKLSQAFGMNVDAMKMMQEQDPASRLSMLQKAFKETGKSIESMSRQEKKLLAQQSGLDEEAASLAFSQRGLSMSYDQVQKAGAKSEKKQLSQAEAMSKLADSIERVFGSGGSSQFKGFFDSFSKGFQTGIMRSMEFRSAMRAIRQSLRAIYRGGIEVGKMFVKLFPGVKDMLKGIKDLFNPDNFRKLMVDVKRIFGDLFKDLQSDPKAGVEKFLQRFKDLFKKFFSASGPGASTLLEGGKTFIKTLGAIFKAVLPIVVSGLVSAINKITEILREPPGVPTALTDLFKDLGSAMMDLLSSLWERLSPALGDMFMTLFEKVGPWLAKGGVAILAAALGKVILSAVMTGLGGGVAVVVSKKIADFFGAAFQNADPGEGGGGGITRKIGEAFSSGVSGIIQGMKSGLKMISEIPYKDIMGAAGRLLVLAVTFLPTLILFAAGVRLVAAMFDIKTALTAVAAMTAVAITAGAIALLIPVLQTIQPGLLGQAITGAAAAALFVVTGVLILAGALRLVSGAFSGLDWTELAKGMAGLAVSVIAIGVMVLAAALLGMDGGTTAAIAVVGLVAATMFVLALSAFMLPLMLVANILRTVDMDPKPWISMAAIIVSIAAMAVASALMIGAGPAGIAGIVFAGLYMFAFVEGMLPMLEIFSNRVGDINFGKTATALVKMAIGMAALAILAAATAVAGAASLVGLVGLGYTAMFVLLLSSSGFLDALVMLAEGINTLTMPVDALPNVFDKLSTAMLHIGKLAVMTAAAGLGSAAGIIGIWPVTRFIKSIAGDPDKKGSDGLMAQLSNFVSNMPDLSSADSKIETLGKVLGLIADLAGLSESLSVYSLPFMGSLLDGGMARINSFGTAITVNIGTFAKKISELDINPEKFAQNADALGSVFEIVAAMSESASALANIDTGWFGPSSTEVLASAKDFISQISTSIQQIVTAVTGVSLDPSKIASVTALGGVFKTVGDLVKGLQPDPKVLEAMKSDNWFGDDMQERMEKLPDLMSRTMRVVSAQIVPITGKIAEAAGKLGDIETMGPKIKLLGNAFSVVGIFTKTIGAIIKDVIGDDIDDAPAAIEKFNTILGGVVDALFSNPQGGYLQKAFDGIKALTDSIGGDAAALEPKIKAVASMFDIIGKFGSAIGDVAKLMPEPGVISGALDDTFTTRLDQLAGPDGLISKISAAVSGNIRTTFDNLKNIVNEIPEVGKGKLKQFEQKAKVLAGIFDILGKFASAIKDVSSLGAAKEGINADAMTSILNSVNAALFNQGTNIGGAMKWIVDGLSDLITKTGDKLVGKSRQLKALSDTFKMLGDFASGISSIKSLGGEGGDMSAVSSALHKIAEEFSSGTLVSSITRIVDGMSVLQTSLARHPLNVRNVSRLTEFANGLSTAITALETIAGPSTGIQARVTQLGAAFDELDTQFSRLGNDGSTALAVGVGRALTGEGRVTVEHEIANINLHVNIQLSAEDIGRGVITWSKRTESSSTNADPRFQLRTSG